MTKNYSYLYTEEDVFEALKEHVLAPEYLHQFESKEDFNLVANALKYLCHAEEIIMHGNIYYQNDVRSIIVNELNSENIFSALKLFKDHYYSKGTALLGWLILREQLGEDEVAQFMYEYDFGRGA